MAAKIVVFILFLAGAYALVPPFVNIFVDAQIRIGNAKHPMIRWMHPRRWTVIWAFWIVWTAGLVLALPAMIEDGFFNP